MESPKTNPGRVDGEVRRVLGDGDAHGALRLGVVRRGVTKAGYSPARARLRVG